MDEFKEERESIKNAPTKEKLEYFWTYYKWHVIVTVVSILVVVSFVTTILNKKDPGFYAVVLNGYAGPSSEDYVKNMEETLGLDTSKEQCLFDTSVYIDFEASDQRSMASAQKVMVYLSAGELDVMIGEVSTVQHYAYSESFADLRDFLTPEQVEKYKDRFLYMDRKIISEKAEAMESNTTYNYAFPKDPTDPSTLEDPIPVGINISDCKDITDNFAFATPDLYICPFVNTKHADRVLAYIDSLFD